MDARDDGTKITDLGDEKWEVEVKNGRSYVQHVTTCYNYFSGFIGIISDFPQVEMGQRWGTNDPEDSFIEY